MIVNWITFDNRQRRRAARAKARRNRVAMRFDRISSRDVSAHIVALTRYLEDPRAIQARERAEHVENVHYYIATGEKAGDAPPKTERLLYKTSRNLFS